MQEKLPAKNELFPKNSEIRKIFDGKVEATILGRDEKLTELGWSLTGLNSKEAFLDPKREPLLSFLKAYAKRYGIKTFKAPIAYPRHNGKLNRADMWGEEYKIDNELTIKKGADFEGCEIKEGEAFIMAPADCLTVVVTNDEGQVYAMHAGRDSIIDMTDINRKTLVQGILEAFPETHKDNLRVWIGFGVKAGEHFTDSLEDEKYGNLNKLRMNYLKGYFGDDSYTEDGHINLQQTIFNMCKVYGINNVEVDNSFYSYSGEAKDDRKYYSSRGGDEKGRNLVIVRKI